MISRNEIQALIDRPANGNNILSAFLDMSVNSENKRTFDIFLNKQKARHSELDSDRPGHHREALGEAFARLERWVTANFEQANKGLAIYVELDGDWIDGYQIPLPLENRLVTGERPVVGPLVEIVESYHHHGVVLVDREHLRLLSFYLDQALHEQEVQAEPYPTPHDVKRGGFSAKDFQDRKEEETRHFFKEFATAVEDFDRRHRPDDLILLGTHENVQKFSDFLSESIRKKVVHTDRMEPDASPTEIREKLAPVFRNRLQEEETRAVNLLHERVREKHLAVAGFDETLEQLQEGKVETLVVGRGLERKGGRCTQCSFLLARTSGSCPYCGGSVSNNVDLVEEIVRLGEDQNLRLDFVPQAAVQDLGGVGGLLRF